MFGLKNISSIWGTEKGWVLLDQIIFSVTSFITTILLARQLGVEHFGQYSSVVLYLYLLLSISNAIVVAPFQTLAAKEKNLNHYISAIFVLQLLIIFLLSLLTIFFFQINLSIIYQLKNELWVILLLLFGFLLQDFFRRIFLATQKAKQAFIIDIISGVAQLYWLVFSAYRHELNTAYALFIISVTYLPAIIFAMLFIVFKSGVHFSNMKNYIALNIENGKWLLLTSVLQWWANNFLVAASGIFLGAPALGALRLAQTIFGVMNALLQILENYVLPTAAAITKESLDKLRFYLLQVTKKSFLILLPVVLCCLIFPRQIFYLCGGNTYTNYAYALQGIALLYLLIFCGYPVRIAIRVLLLNKQFFIAYCGSFVFSVLFAKFLIQQWQLMGVIISLILNQLIMLGYWQWTLIQKKFILWK